MGINYWSAFYAFIIVSLMQVTSYLANVLIKEQK